MSDTWLPANAWEPVTPRGVAAFAHAPCWRLFLVQLLTALIVALTAAWCLHGCWFPTVTNAIAQLPGKAEIRAGRLDGVGSSPRVLAAGTFLALSLDPDHSGRVRSPAHVEVEFGRTSFRIRSILGYVEMDYPRGWVIAANHDRLNPLWRAWRAPLLGLLVLSGVAGLMGAWMVLAMVYSPVVKLLVFFCNRDLRFIQCWRLAGAALMPGAWLMIGGIVLYRFGVVDLVGWGFIFAGHVLLAWVYLWLAPPFLPRTPEAAREKKNPFARTGG